MRTPVHHSACAPVPIPPTAPATIPPPFYDRLSIADLPNGKVTPDLEAADVEVVRYRRKATGTVAQFPCPTCAVKVSNLYRSPEGYRCRRCAAAVYCASLPEFPGLAFSRAFALYDRIGVDYTQWPRDDSQRRANVPTSEYRRLLTQATLFDQAAIADLRRQANAPPPVAVTPKKPRTANVNSGDVSHGRARTQGVQAGSRPHRPLPGSS